MASINKVILVGRLGKDPERKQTKAGKEFSTFPLATSKKNGEEEKTTWHNCVVWNEFKAKYVNDFACKGTTVYLEGEIDARTYQKPDGSTGYATDIVVTQYNGTVEIMSDGVGRGANEAKRPDDPGARAQRGRPANASREEKTDARDNELNDEIPF